MRSVKIGLVHGSNITYSNTSEVFACPKTTFRCLHGTVIHGKNMLLAFTGWIWCTTKRGCSPPGYRPDEPCNRLQCLCETRNQRARNRCLLLDGELPFEQGMAVRIVFPVVLKPMSRLPRRRHVRRTLLLLPFFCNYRSQCGENQRSIRPSNVVRLRFT